MKSVRVSPYLCRNIERASNKGFVLFFMNNKFKLELRAMSDEQLSEWVEFLQVRSMWKDLILCT